METGLYNYFTGIRRNIPYYYPVSLELWRESMFGDRDYDREPLFSQLKTLLLINERVIKGFIQFGLTSFVFDTNGEKNFTENYAVIRNLHYCENAENAHILWRKRTDIYLRWG